MIIVGVRGSLPRAKARKILGTVPQILFNANLIPYPTVYRPPPYSSVPSDSAGPSISVSSPTIAPTNLSPSFPRPSSDLRRSWEDPPQLQAEVYDGPGGYELSQRVIPPNVHLYLLETRVPQGLCYRGVVPAPTHTPLWKFTRE